jgi:hypothetical protein
MGSLRSGSYTDQYGNPISKSSSLVSIVHLLTVYPADPDLSNPTRPRWERPLDTIRSFEAAIDAEYKARQTLFRPGTISPFPTLRNRIVAHNNL